MEHLKTKSKYGYTHEEIEELLNQHPEVNKDMFFEALMGNTGIVDDGKFITYFSDVELAFRCGIENRKVKLSEWD